MRRSKKVLGFMLAAALLGGACGGNSNSVADTSPDSTPADESTADTSVEDDRERNVSATGFGDNGNGITSTRIADNVETHVDSRVFRRVRLQDVDGRSVLNFRDVFVVTVVSRTIGDKMTNTLHVDGYETEGDDPASYPIVDFGDAGRVSIELADKSPDWSNWPTGYTVLSRDLLAVSFASATADSDSAGMVEFYDLPSGRPNTTLGKNGRIIVPKSTGMDDVYDVALREIGDDGKPRLVVAGTAYTETENEYVDDDVVIAGFTVDGALDPAVGEGGSGTISLRSSLASFGTNSIWNIRLADPGLSTAKGVIGAAVTSWIPDMTREFEGWAPDEIELVGLVARAPRSGGPITMDAANGAYANALPTGLQNVGLRNISLDIDNSLDLHISGLPYGSGTGPRTTFDNEVVTFTGGSQTQDVSRRPQSAPYSNSNDSLVRRGKFIADISSEGKRFSVELYNDLERRATLSVICFEERVCDVEKLPGVRQVSDIPLAEGSWTTLKAMKVDTAGVHLVVQRDTALAGQSVSLVSFATDGSGVGGEPATFRGDFDSYNSASSEEGDDTSRYNVRWVDGLQILGARRLASVGSNRADWDTNFILVSDAGKEPREVALSLPLAGITSYSADAGAVTAVDETSIALRADVHSDSGREMRVYKVNVDNGSVDIGFGADGYASVPEIRRDDDCRWSEILKSGPGVVALLVIDHDLKVVDGGEDCSEAPQTVSWASFTTTGKALGNGMVTVDLDPVGFTRVTDYLFDTRGSLYVVGYVDVYDGGDFISSNVVIAKFAATGAADPSFGTNGVVTFEGTSNALFGAGIELVSAIDAEGRVHLAAPLRDDWANTDVLVTRLTVAGLIDEAIAAEPPTAGAPIEEQTTPRQEREKAEVAREAKSAFVAAEKTAEERQAALPADSGLTVTATRPVLTTVKAVEDRSLTVWWSQPATKQGYVTATAMPGGRTCTSNEGSCIIRGLDPTVAYSVTVAPKGEEPTGTAAADAVVAKPVVSLKLGRIASPTTYVRPASRGKATWKVRGGCTLNETKTRITAPKRATTCQLSVTTAKFGSTPKTTKSVTIVVKK